jgi:acetyl esterase
MQIDTELSMFIGRLQQDHAAPEAEDLPDYVERYAAMSAKLPALKLPVATGDLNLRLGGKPVPTRLYWPAGAQRPTLMAWFIGGGWVAGTLATHDGLCRQIAHDLGVALVSVQINAVPGQQPLQCCEDALLALQALMDGRAKLAVNTQKLIVGGDGSGAHLGLQAAWRLQRLKPGSIDSVLALYPLVKPDFNTMSYQRFARSPVFSREDAVRAWNVLLQGNRELWDERAVLSHGSSTPLRNPPAVVLLAAEQDAAHDDAIYLHDWLHSVGSRCEYFGAPGMPHDFARMQHASASARKLMVDALSAFSQHAKLQV